MVKPKQKLPMTTAAPEAGAESENNRIVSELAEMKNFLDNILQSSIKHSIIGQDLDRRILSWNEGARRNYGYVAEDRVSPKEASS
ncbi:MAG: hypothetical protein HY921_10230 [Elusimicrobia bacterium]|nr:hypothetical protein [Elusimicrobiota bacterium]